jgi:hypothetical protein
MGGYIIRPHYQEKEEIRYYRTKQQRRVRRQEIILNFIKRVDINIKTTKHETRLIKPKEKPQGIGLEELPAEVLENILSYLISPLACYARNPTPKSLQELKMLQRYSDYRSVLKKHPFYQLAATCHTLRSVVECFSHYLLHQYEDILCFDIPELGFGIEEWRERIKLRKRIDSKEVGQLEEDESMKILPPFRLMWVRWSYCHCLFCGRQTNRRAIFNHFIWVCHACDVKQWPKLVSHNFIHIFLEEKIIS